MAPLRVAFFDSKPYDIEFMTKANEELGYELKFFTPLLSVETLPLAAGYDAICLFTNDTCDAKIIDQAAELGIRLILMRCAGFDRVDLEAAAEAGITVCRVPAYSPYAVAEHAVALLLCLNRHLHVAYNRVRDGNFSLAGLQGFDLHGKTAGVVGTGKIGQCFIDIMIGFGCKILANDAFINPAYEAKPEVTYVSLEELLQHSDIISLHVPLMETTRHMINAESLKKMKSTAILVNTSRGGLVDTSALVEVLKQRKIGGAALDVYEEEDGYFFEDCSADIIMDDTLARLQNMKNCLVTSHQAFFTNEALSKIASTTMLNVREFNEGKRLKELTNYVQPPNFDVAEDAWKARGMTFGGDRMSHIVRSRSRRGTLEKGQADQVLGAIAAAKPEA